MSDILQSIGKRRSIYNLKSGISLSDAELEARIGQAIRQTPSAFNMQSQRVVLLLGAHHKTLWNQITADALRPQVPPDSFGRTQQKLASFAAGYGTLLYFDDTGVTKAYGEQNPLYKDNFPVWAQQQNGMLQMVVWTALAEAGIGASLQHYNPLIDEGVQKQWNLPKEWLLVAQMPFGDKGGEADEKEFEALEERFKIIR